MRRYVLTGPPGSGKTSIAMALRARGWAVVEEAATEVIARQQALGVAEPWRDADFINRIAALQRDRQLPEPTAANAAQFFDRSPLCTLALAQFLGERVTPALQAEIERVLEAGVYQRSVFFVRPLGFIIATAARTISYEDSLRFEAVHEQVYREHGFELIDIPSGSSVEQRAAIIEGHLTSMD